MRPARMAIVVIAMLSLAPSTAASGQVTWGSSGSAYGPFRVIGWNTATLVGATDERSPAAFLRMLRDHPDVTVLSFVECPGTYDDDSNLALGRLIRQAGLAAHVPAGGSVRSGAIDLLLAGTRRKIDGTAVFAVHAWRDQYGYEANDYAPTSREHVKYLVYYTEMGMSDRLAAAFYSMTNAPSHRQPRWITGNEMRAWIAEKPDPPRLAYSSRSFVRGF